MEYLASTDISPCFFKKGGIIWQKRLKLRIEVRKVVALRQPPRLGKVRPLTNENELKNANSDKERRQVCHDLL